MKRLALIFALFASPAAASAGLELHDGCWWRQNDSLHWIKVNPFCRERDGGQSKAAPEKPKDPPRGCKPGKGHGKDKGHGHGKEHDRKNHGKGMQ